MKAQQLFRSLDLSSKRNRILLGIAIVVISIEAFYAIVWRQNDYSVHLRYGAFFLEGAPYQSDGATAFYPLGRLWLNAGVASIEYYTGRTFCYFAAIGSLIFTLEMWRRMAIPAMAIPARQTVPAVAWTLFILSPFLIRDLDECGLQLFLLFFLTAAGYCLVHRKLMLGGFWIATAIVYKATPLLFLPLLIWKREWKMAGWTALFTVILSILPATYLGWSNMLESQRFWFTRAATILQEQQAYPSVPGIEAPKIQNESLKALIARYVAHYPESHPLTLDHPLFVQFGSLTDSQARPIVTGIVLLLGVVIALRMWGPWKDPQRNTRFAPDWAVACLFVALLSPLCWRQHLVMALPCAYLVARERLADRPSVGWRRWVPIAAAFLILLTRREILGEELAFVALSYKLNTIAVLSYVVLCLTLSTRRQPAEIAQLKTEPARHPLMPSAA